MSHLIIHAAFLWCCVVSYVPHAIVSSASTRMSQRTNSVGCTVFSMINYFLLLNVYCTSQENRVWLTTVCDSLNHTNRPVRYTTMNISPLHPTRLFVFPGHVKPLVISAYGPNVVIAISNLSFVSDFRFDSKPEDRLTELFYSVSPRKRSYYTPTLVHYL
jgi:hypothetical protein